MKKVAYHTRKNSIDNQANNEDNRTNKWNPIYMFIFPLIWVIWAYQNINAERIELKVSEAVGASILIIIVPIIITTFTLIIKKLRKKEYINYIKHTTIGTFILFLLAIGAEVNTSLEQKNISNANQNSKFPNNYKSNDEIMNQIKLAKQALDNKDYSTAKYHMEKLLELGVPEAYSGLAKLYYDGKGVLQNYSKALELYEKGCVNDDAGGCRKAGKMYIKGINTEQDVKKARELLSKYVELGQTDLWLAGYTFEQEGYVFDAYDFYKKGCAMNDVESCIILGEVYEKGKGVRQDNLKALKSFGKACDLKMKRGCDKYAELNKLVNSRDE